MLNVDEECVCGRLSKHGFISKGNVQDPNLGFGG